ncbi:LPD38 domain-containing protein [Halomonas elongata]|uniref:LPD38 domain-containing protein n=1 Tax=Halomonas elongata TaxID=2746 RepID=UPI0040349AB2
MNAADQPQKTPKWSDIANDPAFQNADKATRQEVRGKFFDRVVRPNTPDGMLEEVQSKFFTQTEDDVFGDKPESVTDGDAASGDGPSLASNALRNAGERGLDLTGNALQFVGNMAEKGEQLIAENLGGLNPGVVGGDVSAMRESGYEPDLEVGGYGLDFTTRANPEDTKTGLNTAGQAVEDVELGYQPNYTIDRALEDPSLETLAGAAAEQGPAALADMAGLVVNPPTYLAARTEEIGEGRVQNDGREGIPEWSDYAVSGPTATASVLLDRFALGKLLPGGKGAVGNARQVPGAVGRATATEAGTEAVQEGGIEYAGESVGTEQGWSPKTAGRRAAGGAIVGGPTGGAVRLGTATAEVAGNRSTKSQPKSKTAQEPEYEGAGEPVQRGEAREGSTPKQAPDSDAVRAAADLIRQPRSELSSAEREARDSITDGEAFKALRATAEEQGDTEAVAELDAIHEEVSSELEEETLSRSRGEGGPTESMRQNLEQTAQRFSSVMERLNSQDKGGQEESSAPSAGLNMPENQAKADPESQEGSENGLSYYRYGDKEMTEQAWREAWKQEGVPPDDTEGGKSAGDRPTGLQMSEDAGPGQKTASVPTMMTNEMRQQLRDLGHSDEEIRKLRPQEAWDRIQEGRSTSEKVENAAKRTDTEPTPAQAEAGNYRKGRVQLEGMDIAIENPKGSTRRGTDEKGREWESQMAHHYGDIKGTVGADGDNLDAFVGDRPENGKAFVIDQVNDDGSFDEHKVMLGFDSADEAREGYLANYAEGWQGLGEISEVDAEGLKSWMRDGDTQAPFSMPQKKATEDRDSAAKQPSQSGLDLSMDGATGHFSAKPEADSQTASRGATATSIEGDGKTSNRQAPTSRVPIDQIEVDPAEYQFRTEVNDEGVDSRLEGVERWDDVRAGNLMLHEREDGRLFAADGHHRLDLARRTGQKDVNAQILREKDGVSVADARREAAETNIADGNATASDAAKVFRNSEGDTGDIIAERNLPRRSQVVRDGADLTKLSDEAFGAVLNNVVKEKDGAAIGRAFDDPDQQLAAVDAFKNVDPQNDNQRQLLVNEVKQAGFADSQGEQSGLFGDDPMESLISERVKVMDKLRQDLVRDRRLFATLNKNADKAQQAGNRIATDQNEVFQDASAQALDVLERATTTPEINQQINNAARRVNSGESVAKAASELKETLLNGNPATDERQRSSAPDSEPDATAGLLERPDQQTPGADDTRAEGAGQPRLDGGEGTASGSGLLGGTDLSAPVREGEQREETAETRRGATEAVNFKADGNPFPTRRAVQASKRYRDTPGAKPVEVEGGWGFVLPDQSRQSGQGDVNQESAQPSQDGDDNYETYPDQPSEDVDPAPQQGGAIDTPSSGLSRPPRSSEPTRRQRRSAEELGGIAQGDAIELDADVGYARAGGSYRVNTIQRDGRVHVTNSDSGASTILEREDIAAASQRSGGPVARRVGNDEDPLLETQTEESLAQRENEVRQAEQSEADRRRQEEERAQADAEVDDFRLTGSNSDADIAASHGQDPLFSLRNGGDSAAWERAEAKGLDMSQEGRMQRAHDMGYISAIEEAIRGEYVDGQITRVDRGREATGGAETEGAEWPADLGRRSGADDLQRRNGGRDGAGNEGSPRGRGPLTVYHGTAGDVASFVPGHPDRLDSGWLGEGVYLTTDRRVAEHYANRKAQRQDDQEGAAVMPLHIRPESLLSVPPTFKRRLSTAGPAASKAFAQWVQKQGYDGVVTQYGDAYEVAMLDPTKVRSTQAAFDPDGEGSSDLLFSAGNSGSVAATAPRADVIRSQLSDYPELSSVEVVQSASELPEKALMSMFLQGVRPKDVRGLYNPETGSPMIVADNLIDESDAMRASLHEAVGHYGIRGVLGEDLEPVLEQVFRSYTRSEDGRRRIEEIKEAYPHIARNAHTREGRLELAEELIAHTIESDARPKLRERVMSAIRRQLRKLFPGIEWRTSDILALGEQSRRWLRRQQAQRDAEQAAPTITRYSQRRGENKLLADLSPKDMAARLREEFPGLKLDLMGGGQRVTVSRVVAPERGQGIGSAVMQRLTDWADASGRTLALTPSSDFGGNTKRLREFYQRFGFVENKGRHKDYEISEAMYREPDHGVGEIRFSIAKQPGTVGGKFSSTDSTGFAMPDEGLRDVALRKMADKMRPLKIMEDAIRRTGQNIEEEADVYLAEELFHGKVEYDLRQLREQYVEPLAEGLAKAGISQSELDDYLYARHAPERNATIAERNPDDPAMQDGGSGMTNAEAAGVIERVANSGKQAEYDRLASLVYGMTQLRLDAIREGGLEDDSVVDDWESHWQHYVPLKGWAEDTDVPSGENGAGRPRTGKGFEINGRESRIAGGRKTRAASPSSQVIVDANESLIRRRKNEVAQSLLSMVTDHPNPDLWEVFTDDSPDTQRTPVHVTDPETGQKRIEVRDRPVNMAGDHRYFKAKRAGRTYYIKLHDERLMNAMRNVGPENNNALIRAAGTVTRVMSSLVTSYNPEFMLTNFSRDVQTALLNLSAEQTRDDGKIKGKAIVRQTARDIGPAMKAAWRGLQGKEGKDDKQREWNQWFEEFQEDGAKTGYFDMKDMDNQAKEIQSMVRRADGTTISHMLKARKKTTDFVENMNGAVENAVRLSAYANARRAGISRKQAASLAKNMTVNFNRRGEAGTALNAAYMFANASIQGTMNFARTMVTVKDTPDGKSPMNVWSRMNLAQKLGLGMATGSFMLGMLNRWLSEEDDDGVLFYDKIPDYEKERSLVLMTGWMGGDAEDYIKIPLPYGYNVFSVVGTHAEAVAAGSEEVTEAAKNLVLAVAGSFSPIGFEDSDEAHSLLLKNLTPTLFRSIAHVGVNEDFSGRPVYREEFPFGTPTPDSSRAFRSTPEAYKGFANFLNEFTGGTDNISGAVDVSPDVMQHLVNYFGGGAWGFVEKSADFSKRSMTGEEVDRYRVPFAGRFMGSVNEYGDMQRFYERRDELGQLAKEADSLRGMDRVNYRRNNQQKLRLFNRATHIEKRLRELRKRRDHIEATEALTDEARKRRIDMLEKQMQRWVDGFNRRYNEVVDG